MSWDRFDDRRDRMERGLLAGLLALPEAAQGIALHEDEFSDQDRYAVYRGIVELSADGGRVSRIQLKQYLDRLGGGVSLRSDWYTVFDHTLDGPVTIEELRRYAWELKDLALRARYATWFEREAASPLDLSVGVDELLSRHAAKVTEFDGLRNSDIEPTAAAIYRRAQLAQASPYYPSGLQAVDEKVRGLRAGHLWVLSGPYKSRKTTCALNLVAHQLREGKHVAYIALEDDDQGFFDKLAAIWGDLDHCHVEVGSATARDPEIGPRVRAAKEELSQANLRIYDARLGVHDWRMLPSLVAGDRLRYGQLDVVVIDYVQAFSTRYEDLQAIVPMLLRVAGEEQVALIALSQMSNSDIRDNRAGAGVAGMLATKSTGDLGAACHVGIEVRGDPEAPDELELNVKVVRNGVPGRVFARLNPASGHFYQVTANPNSRVFMTKEEIERLPA